MRLLFPTVVNEFSEAFTQAFSLIEPKAHALAISAISRAAPLRSRSRAHRCPHRSSGARPERCRVGAGDHPQRARRARAIGGAQEADGGAALADSRPDASPACCPVCCFGEVRAGRSQVFVCQPTWVSLASPRLACRSHLSAAGEYSPAAQLRPPSSGCSVGFPCCCLILKCPPSTGCIRKPACMCAACVSWMPSSQSGWHRRWRLTKSAAATTTPWSTRPARRLPTRIRSRRCSRNSPTAAQRSVDTLDASAQSAHR